MITVVAPLGHRKVNPEDKPNVYEDMAVDFLTSLRHVGKHDGAIYLIDYGITDAFKQFAAPFDVDFCKVDEPESKWIINDRFLACKKMYDRDWFTDEYLVMYDIDVWFQRPLKTIRKLLWNSLGVVMAPGRKRQTWPWLGPKDMETAYLEKVEKISAQWGAIINGGMIAGQTDNVGMFMGELTELYHRYGMRDDYKLETALIMQAHSEAFDSLEGCNYNTIVHRDGVYPPGQPIRDKNGEVATAVHMVGKARSRPDLWFRGRTP